MLASGPPPQDWFGGGPEFCRSSLWLLCVHLLAALWHSNFACYSERFSLPHTSILVSGLSKHSTDGISVMVRLVMPTRMVAMVTS